MHEKGRRIGYRLGMKDSLNEGEKKVVGHGEGLCILKVLEQSFHFIFKLDQFRTYPIFIPCFTNVILVYLIYGMIF
jgi:hypothetical protein